jgi:hypothetical protein
MMVKGNPVDRRQPAGHWLFAMDMPFGMDAA